ncbi:MAG: response regulator [Proteobacteria bacterium]|nr:response regulator [Pseudomonadota bacterium]
MNGEAKTILILDDDDAVRISLAEYFEDRGWRPMQATSGEEALKLLAGNTPDAAVVDIRLGAVSGDAFIRKAHEMQPELVYVVYTGSPEYRLAEDLAMLTPVSENVFIKPVTLLGTLEEEILRMIASKPKSKTQPK